MPTNASDDVIVIKGTEKSRGKSTRATPADAAIKTPTTAAKPPINVDKKKKRSGSFGIFKAALLMFRGRPGEREAKKSTAKQNSVAPNGNWTDLVGSVRPLRLNRIDQSPPPSISPDSTPQSETPPAIAAEDIEDFTPTSASPAWSSSCATSHYASASSLRDLVDSSDDEEDDPDEVFDAITGDEMIDAKAEEFIAQFYKQIQLQNTAAIHHQRQRTI